MGSVPPSFHKIHVVATPIGHLDDLTERAREVLRRVPVIAAEDTRVSRTLLDHIGARARLIAVHEHNEAAAIQQLSGLLREHEVALICDAGTPAISDPGARLLAGLTALGIQAVPVPGASAVTALMSVAGLGDGRFRFEGFPATRSKARQDQLRALARSEVTVVFFESPHRIEAFAQDLASVVEPDRPVVVGRELTKRFEQIVHLQAGALSAWLASDENHRRGEFVLALGPAPAAAAAPDAVITDVASLGALPVEAAQLLQALCEGLPASKAAKWAARLTGRKDVDWYRLASDHKRL